MVYIIGLFLLSCVWSNAAYDFDSEHPLVEAVVGGHAILPCNVSNPLEDDEATLILWYRLDYPNPIYTLDVRNAAIKNAKHFPSDEMGDRAQFDVSVHPPVLVLADVTTDDEADYKCRVDLRRSRTLILHSRLRVIVPPSEPIIMDEHGQHLHDVVGPYDEGSTITFICEVDGGTKVLSPEIESEISVAEKVIVVSPTTSFSSQFTLCGSNQENGLRSHME
ncbi:uncharacterized protein LOC129962147 [Argiope bruennichi]|uniref:uncharacterized protein LOC129962147 n=1 Tax=Argiope bruennichi TaxID=94029 RepID=UPI00249462CB|nr:uncharacterized protein LOC129962147 [Argiope bruennichi]